MGMICGVRVRFWYRGEVCDEGESERLRLGGRNDGAER